MSISEQLEDFEQVLTSDNFDIHLFHEELSCFVSKHQNDLPLELFKLFKNYHVDDGFERAMWTLLHAIETLEGDAFIEKIIPGLKLVARDGSEWAELFVMRILNSIEYRNKLAIALKDASSGDKETWSKAVRNLTTDEPEFEIKAKSIFASLI